MAFTQAQITLVTSAIGAFIGLIPVAVTAYVKLMEVLKPLISRRKAKIAILASEDQRTAATAFLTSLRTQGGYRDVILTHSPATLGDRQIVIVWRPTNPEAQLASDAIRKASPTAYQLTLSYPRLDLKLSDQVLCVNSPMRLRGDLAVLAESM